MPRLVTATPPTDRWERSMRATRLPTYAALAAAFSPAGPEPMTIRSKGSTSGPNSRVISSASRGPEAIEQGRRLVRVPTSAEPLEDRQRIAYLVEGRSGVRRVCEGRRELQPDPTGHDRPLLGAEDVQRLLKSGHCPLPLRAVHRDPALGQAHRGSKHRALGRHGTRLQPLERQLGTLRMVACQLYLDEQLEQPPCAESVADEIVQSAVDCGGSQVRLIAQQVETRQLLAHLKVAGVRREQVGHLVEPSLHQSKPSERSRRVGLLGHRSGRVRTEGVQDLDLCLAPATGVAKHNAVRRSTVRVQDRKLVAARLVEMNPGRPRPVLGALEVTGTF